MYVRKRKAGFSLVELLAAIAIIALLAALLMSAGPKTIAKARAVECMGNLKNISYALAMFQTNYGTFPPDGTGSFLNYLWPYLDDDDAKHCPRDPVPGHNSYEDLYVSRPEGDSPMGLTVVCPYHLKDNMCVVSTFDGSTHMGKPSPVVDGNGTEIAFGQVFTGTITFADGTVLQRGGANLTTTLIASYRDNTGRLYSVVRSQLDFSGTGTMTGWVNATVTPGSRFEVVTPAAIAGVHGTKFSVNLEEDANGHTTVVAVQEGSVNVIPRCGGSAEELLYAGDSKLVTCSKPLYPMYEDDDDDDDDDDD